jgi:hypothetical protein
MSTMLLSSALQAPATLHTSQAGGPDTQSEQDSDPSIAEKVAQSIGKTGESAVDQVTPRQEGSDAHSCWHSSGLGTSGVREEMRAWDQVVPARRQEGKEGCGGALGGRARGSRGSRWSDMLALGPAGRCKKIW